RGSMVATPAAPCTYRGLARVAEAHEIGCGLGSQRAMHRTPALAHTFAVRDHAPTTLVLANLGLVQATALPSADVERLARAVGAGAVCIHLNPAQALIQANRDRDFRHGAATAARH